MSTQMMQTDFHEIAELCHAALAQDSPNTPEIYIGQILNLAFAHLTSAQKADVEVYLAEKKYLPPVTITLAK